MKSICVVGAGVIGLSTAVNLVTSCPAGGGGWEVTVMADKFSPDTISDGAAGIYKPHTINGDQFVDIMRWCKLTWDHLEGLLNTAEAREAGVFVYSGYQMYKKQEPNREYAALYRRYSDCNKDEVMSFGGQYLSGVFYTTLGCEGTSYLPWLMKRFKDNGGKVIQKRIQSFLELYNDYDVIVNCTGIGSHHLVPDKSLKPVRGQVIKVVAPWIKNFYFEGAGDYYIIPGINEVTLGGTYYTDDWTERPTEKDKQDIWKNCCRMVPSIEKAKIVSDWSGFRPWRSEVRLEVEPVKGNVRTQAIVHNYGHGGSGVTLHWGCAVEACQMVKQQLGVEDKKLPSKL